jgi:myo-inositol-1(or 4)-monophosphatase
MFSPNLSDLLAQATEVVEHADALLAAKWNRPEGPRGGGDKAAIDVDIERFLRPALLHLFKCYFWVKKPDTF